MKRKSWRWVPFALLLLLGVALFVWAGTPYRADDDALRMLSSDAEVQVVSTEFGWLFDGPSEESALIFYPGGRVEATAYAPLLHRLAAGGLDVCLVRMPMNLAFFGTEKALTVMDQFDYAHWYIGGHSLGGAVAALFASAHGERLDGLALCAAYPTKPLDSGLKELLLCGTEDGVLNRARFESGRQYDTADTETLSIEGGNHAQFGSYGAQKGDGEARITAAQQQEEAAGFILRGFGAA